MAEIGSTLREARMRAHIDITEVETSTKIRAKYLRAIENEEWDLLPGSVYVKSFLRTYSDFLGLDSRLLIDEFKRRYERPADHEARQISGLSRERERTSRRRARPSFSLSPRLVIGAALLVIVVALWVYGNNSSPNTASTGRGITPPGAGHHKHGGSGVVAGRGGTKSRTSSSTTTTGTTPTIAAVKKATLQLVPTGTAVWVCVEGPNKKVLIRGVDYVSGDKIPAVSAKKLWVDLGNANVTAKVNGKPYTITHAPGSSGIGLTITAAGGAKSIASPPTCAS
jgi:cytoskeleton protein RodZ